jgi:hypothetical protein
MKPGSRKINALFFLCYSRHSAEILRLWQPAGDSCKVTLNND